MMMINDQLDFNRPEHVTLMIDENRLKIYITGKDSSIKLTYELKHYNAISIDPRPPTAAVITEAGVQVPSCK